MEDKIHSLWNWFKSWCEAKMKPQRPNESNQVEIFQPQCFYCQSLSFLFLFFHLQLNRNTKRECDAKQTVNVSEIHLIWSQTAEASEKLIIYCLMTVWHTVDSALHHWHWKTIWRCLNSQSEQEQWLHWLWTPDCCFNTQDFDMWCIQLFWVNFMMKYNL